MVTIPSLRTIPRAPKLGKKIHLKKVLNWAKKVRIWKPAGGQICHSPLKTNGVDFDQPQRPLKICKPIYNSKENIVLFIGSMVLKRPASEFRLSISISNFIFEFQFQDIISFFKILDYSHTKITHNPLNALNTPM